MNNFKRLLGLMLVLCMTLCLVACGGGNAESTGSAQGNESTQTTGNTESTQSTDSTETTSDGKVDYRVTVVDQDGNPVAGAYVQICLDDLCYSPVATGEDGVATFRLAEQDGYKTKLAAAVDGYVLEDYIYFESGATEITITLVPAE